MRIPDGSQFTVKAWLFPHLHRIARDRGQSVSDVVHQALVRLVIESDEPRLRSMLESAEDSEWHRTAPPTKPFTEAVISFVQTRESWTGTLSDLLERIPAPSPVPERWPADATRASRFLKEGAPELKRAGIDVTFGRSRDQSRSRVYTLTSRRQHGGDSSRTDR
ncbi:hypothetical protein [Murinocardiopsis flavida]|uniref:hypothetical protein n=1 Tax=Murinocardiopsis flavida TaxID=645275 RepID=UPI0011B299E3|nr:hypothetical protein [Murinocardiopsis flavida]